MAYANWLNERDYAVLSLISKIITCSSHSSKNYEELIGDNEFKTEVTEVFLKVVTYLRSLVR